MDSAGSRSKGKKAKPSTPEKTPVRGKSAPRADVARLVEVDPDERHRMIALAAYYRAERRGFTNGDPLQDWLEAEAEVTVQLQGAATGRPAS
ncbi:MAG TPA: DUF2934 domain-containing protein [Candidatus Methylomirabilis sp.]|nr:DUF2934 domain-containing protein [Candidatus Methylomirabilis sp.]